MRYIGIVIHIKGVGSVSQVGESSGVFGLAGVVDGAL